jgi:hypothetical protein
MAAKTLEGGGVAPKIIGAPPPKVSAAKRAGLADLGAKNYVVSSNAKGGPCRSMRRGASTADAADVGAGVGPAQGGRHQRNEMAKAREARRARAGKQQR